MQSVPAGRSAEAEDHRCTKVQGRGRAALQCSCQLQGRSCFGRLCGGLVRRRRRGGAERTVHDGGARQRRLHGVERCVAREAVDVRGERHLRVGGRLRASDTLQGGILTRLSRLMTWVF